MCTATRLTSNLVKGSLDEWSFNTILLKTPFFLLTSLLCFCFSLLFDSFLYLLGRVLYPASPQNVLMFVPFLTPLTHYHHIISASLEMRERASVMSSPRHSPLATGSSQHSECGPRTAEVVSGLSSAALYTVAHRAHKMCIQDQEKTSKLRLNCLLPVLNLQNWKRDKM